MQAKPEPAPIGTCNPQINVGRGREDTTNQSGTQMKKSLHGGLRCSAVRPVLWSPTLLKSTTASPPIIDTYCGSLAPLQRRNLGWKRHAAEQSFEPRVGAQRIEDCRVRIRLRQILSDLF